MENRYNLSLIQKWSLALLGVAAGTCSFAQREDAVSTQLVTTTLVGENTDGLHALQLEQQTVSEEALDQRNAEDFEDVFRTILAVRAGGGRSQSQDVFIRGLQTTMSNVSIDGAPQGGLIFYHAGSGGTIEPELLKVVTVSAGSSNALSGPGALGGALAYETKDGFDLLSVGKTVGAQLKGTLYASADNGTKLNLMGYGLASSEWSYLASVGLADVGNYTDGRGNEVIDTKYKRKNALVKLAGHLSESQRMSLSYETIEDEGAGGARFNVYPDEASELANYKRRETVVVNYEFDPLNQDWIRMQNKVFWTDRTLEGSDETNGIRTYGFDLRNTSLISEGQVVFAYGIDYQHTANSSSNEPKDEAGSILGFYAQGDWELSDIVTLSAGSRYDQYDLNPRVGEDVTHRGWSPNITSVIKMSDALQLHATYSASFRGAIPIMSKLSSATTDPDIDPEKATNLEVGFDYTRGIVFVSGKIFQTTIDDVIDPRPRNVARTNIGDLKSKGYELNIGVRKGSLSFKAGVIDADPEITTSDGSVYDEYVTINNKTGRVWMGNLEYNLQKLDLSFGWNTEYVERTSAVGNRSTREKASTLVHDAFVQWMPSSGKLEGFSANLSVGNIFDKAYYDQTTFAYESGYAAPGRDIRLSLRYRF